MAGPLLTVPPTKRLRSLWVGIPTGRVLNSRVDDLRRLAVRRQHDRSGTDRYYAGDDSDDDALGRLRSALVDNLLLEGLVGLVVRQYPKIGAPQSTSVPVAPGLPVGAQVTPTLLTGLEVTLERSNGERIIRIFPVKD